MSQMIATIVWRNTYEKRSLLSLPLLVTNLQNRLKREAINIVLSLKEATKYNYFEAKCIIFQSVKVFES